MLQNETFLEILKLCISFCRNSYFFILLQKSIVLCLFNYRIVNVRRYFVNFIRMSNSYASLMPTNLVKRCWKEDQCGFLGFCNTMENLPILHFCTFLSLCCAEIEISRLPCIRCTASRRSNCGKYLSSHSSMLI